MERNAPTRTLTPLLASLLAVTACAGQPGARPLATPAQETAADGAGSVHVYFGGRGIHRSRLDLATGRLDEPSLAAETRGTSYLAVHSSGRFLYAVERFREDAGRDGGAVSAYAVGVDGGLRLLNQVASAGEGGCYVAVDGPGKTVLIAQYGSGKVASFPLRDDGSVGEAVSVVQHEGKSVNPQRQEGPHAHSIIVDPSGRRAFAADLGIDKIMIYRLDSEGARLAPNEPTHGSVAPGGGPRHLAFHPTGRFLYANNELTATVTVFRHDATSGALTEAQTITTLPDGYDGNKSTAQIALTPDGRHLYVSNRGHDSIAMFAVDAATGRLSAIGHEPTQGRIPRNFNLDPSGRFLIAANQESDNAVVFRVDPATGRLSPTGSIVAVPKPQVVVFVR